MKIEDFVSPSTRFKLKRATDWLREQQSRARFWRWEFVRLPGGPHDQEVRYLGRKDRRATALALLGREPDAVGTDGSPGPPGSSVLICDMPIPGAMHVPCYLRSVVPLGRSSEEIARGHDSELRRLLRKRRPHYRMRQVLDAAEIDRLRREMIEPYASARHGDSAALDDAEVVRRMAQEYGRLELLYLDDQEVGCHLGYALTRSGKRYWVWHRAGYPQAVFSDAKRLREANSMNVHLALEYAIGQGFDYYDMGNSLGRPDGALLNWKRRRGGALDTVSYLTSFHVRLPKDGKARFLWGTPLFALEGGMLVLWLGLPEGPSDEEAETRFREMGYAGLTVVRLLWARPPGEQILGRLRSLYSKHASSPRIESLQAD